jgi:flagellum-specific peptidoglycan hydrolase FlgJ
MFQNKRYDAFNRVKANNPLAFISNINNSGYSTTPTSKYASSIMSIYNKI